MFSIECINYFFHQKLFYKLITFETMQVELQISEEFKLAYQYATQTKQSLFLTGKAGTGKTTFLQHLKKNCSKNIIVAAPTGVAAINAGGVTLHSLFGLPFQPYIPVKRGWGRQAAVLDRDDLLAKVRYRKDKLKLLRQLELLVIDEISMVRADLLDEVDVILRSVRNKHMEPFGGVQLLMIGDIFQLPPVARREDWAILQEYYSSEFFFHSKVIEELEPICIQLNTIYRQSDNFFIDLLNKVRNNDASQEDLNLLNERYQPYGMPDNCIRLTTHNKAADDINQNELDKIFTNPYKLKAIVKGDFPEYLYPTEQELILKIGARVMFIKNDISGAKQFYNGKIGEVVEIGDDVIKIKCEENEMPIALNRYTWKNTSFEANEATNKVDEKELGVYEQFPLRLAWAITIHKSQGLTFDYCAIDAAASFAGGQLYVALSRCRSYEGLYLLSKIGQSALKIHLAVVEYFKTLHPENAINSFAFAQNIYAEELLLDLYNFSFEEDCIRKISVLAHDNRAQFSAEVMEKINRLHSSIDQLNNVGKKFGVQIEMLLKNAAPEQNAPLQARLHQANDYYTPLLNDTLTLLTTHGIQVDSKLLSDELSNLLTDLFSTLCLKAHYYKSREPFSASTFFIVRENYERPAFNAYTYSGKGSTKNVPKDTPHPELYIELISTRNSLVEELNKPVYNIASNTSIIEMCKYLPLTKQHLTYISGFGKIKSEQFGDYFLPIIEAYASKHGLASSIHEHSKVNKEQEKSAKTLEREKEKATKEKFGVNASVKQSVDLLNDGFSIEQIAAERKFSVETIYGHMASALDAGLVKAIQVLSIEDIAHLLPIMQANIDADLNTLKGLAGDKYGYGKVKLALVQAKLLAMS
jgi:hypothetical protein